MPDLPRAIHVHRAGTWPADQAQGSITLGFADRHRRRLRLTDDAGRPFLLDLAEAVQLAEGDGLALEGGGWIAVRAATEAVAEVHGGDPAATARLAWHLGNRHTPVQVLADGALRFPDDHVLVTMVEGLGAGVTRRLAPFQPEGGAYGQAAPMHDHHHHHHE